MRVQQASGVGFEGLLWILWTWRAYRGDEKIMLWQLALLFFFFPERTPDTHTPLSPHWLLVGVRGYVFSPTEKGKRATLQVPFQLSLRDRSGCVIAWGNKWHRTRPCIIRLYANTSPQPLTFTQSWASTFLNCRHTVILFWCAAAAAAAALGQHIASVGWLTPPKTWLPRRLSCYAPWIMWDWVDIFIWSANDTLRSQQWCVHWLRRKFPGLSFAYINIFSAPFPVSIAIVLKSGLCHVHPKYLMYLKSWNFLPLGWTWAS